MIINARNTTQGEIKLPDLNGFKIAAQEKIDLGQEFQLYRLAASDDLLEKIALGDIEIDDGTNTFSISEAIRYITVRNITDGPKSLAGLPLMQATTKGEDTDVCWTGISDDDSDVHALWGGDRFRMVHLVGESKTQFKRFDFNTVNNPTLIQRGVCYWYGCNDDTINLWVVPRVTNFMTSTNTNYNAYGPLIVPAAGDGTLEVTSNLTDPNAGLVYIPLDDKKNRPPSFWNADYNSSTKLYENITPAPDGDGAYNLFNTEIVLSHIVNKIPIDGDGSLVMESTDLKQLGHGMRLKGIIETSTTEDDHKWTISFALGLHRVNI